MSNPAHLDRLEVLPVAGSGIEPEEAPAKRFQSLPLTVNLSGGLPEVEERAGRPALAFRGETPVARTLVPVTSEMPAGEVAQLLRERCARCVHFRNEEWQKVKKIWAASPPGSQRKRGLMAILMQFARSVLDRAPTREDLAKTSREMNSWGVCDALSEERSDLVIVHPEACCPDGLAYYKDRDSEARREASSIFDRIMRAAQGRS